MQRIIIKNFGPIKDVDIPIHDFMIFIGPQASGKSTIAKAIYFFKSLRDDLTLFLLDNTNNFEKPLTKFSKIISKKYLDYWGSTLHLSEFSLRYEFKTDIWIEINTTQNEKYVNPIYSDSFSRTFNNLISNAKSHAIAVTSHVNKPQILTESLKYEYQSKLLATVNSLFQDDSELLFIPAGRSLLAILSNQIQIFEKRKIDYLTAEFIQKISSVKENFNKSLPTIIEEHKHAEGIADVLGYNQFNTARKATKIIDKILKGTYINDKDGEKIYVSKDKYIKLNFASSGQQESLWILLMLFMRIIRNYPTFTVIEEPEAHLFPEAQQKICELISLYNHSNRNQVILTTHSPYILTAINNLIYANEVGKINPSKVENFIDKKLWLDYSKMMVYFVDNNVVKPIMDEELKMINSEEIDSASRIINQDYDKLSDIHFQNEL